MPDLVEHEHFWKFKAWNKVCTVVIFDAVYIISIKQKNIKKMHNPANYVETCYINSETNFVNNKSDSLNGTSYYIYLLHEQTVMITLYTAAHKHLTGLLEDCCTFASTDWSFKACFTSGCHQRPVSSPGNVLFNISWLSLQVGDRADQLNTVYDNTHRRSEEVTCGRLEI